MKSSKDQEKQQVKLERLAQTLAVTDSPEDILLFLQDLCTPAELQAMADRWSVVAPIKAGVPYRKIYEATGVSATTVGRIARCIESGTGGYNLVFEKVK